MWQSKKAKPLTTQAAAMEYALSLLDMHDHSEYDLRQKLQRREVKGAMQDAVVAQLQDYGLLDAQRYAEAVYDTWLRKRVYGRQHLRAELLKKHVEPQYVRDLLARLTPAQEQERAEAAVALTQKRKDAKYDPTTKEGAAALGRYLAARGFGHEVLTALLERLKANIE